MTCTRAQSELPAILLSRLTQGPAGIGTLIAYCMSVYTWAPKVAEIKAAMDVLVEKRKAEWRESGCWRVAGGVMSEKGEE